MRYLKLCCIPLLALSLSGCIAAAVAGAGVASGVYFDRHYKVVKKDKTNNKTSNNEATVKKN
ncbi:MAG: hypothetical protein K0U12_02170 [Gammaproteobacteria bacterium]|nr:hypothetical protein [Gammaproteobacteria bacterium]